MEILRTEKIVYTARLSDGKYVIVPDVEIIIAKGVFETDGSEEQFFPAISSRQIENAILKKYPDYYDKSAAQINGPRTVRIRRAEDKATDREGVFGQKQEDDEIKLEKSAIYYGLLVVFMLYLAFSSVGFMWRNPLANSMCVFRDIGDVVTWQKVSYYQPERDE